MIQKSAPWVLPDLFYIQQNIWCFFPETAEQVMSAEDTLSCPILSLVYYLTFNFWAGWFQLYPSVSSLREASRQRMEAGKSNAGQSSINFAA